MRDRKAQRRGRGRHKPEDRWQHIQGLLANLGTWAFLSLFLHLPSFVVAIWGFGVAMHALSIIPKLRAPARAPEALPEAEPRSESEPLPTRESAPPQADPFLAELDAAIDALARTAKTKGMPKGVDLAELRGAAQELRSRHLALVELADPAAREKLTRERDEALAQAGRAQDPRTIEVLQHQARSVSERLSALEQAAGASSRLTARERTLLHQIEALRLSLLQSGVDEEGGPDLAGEVQRLRIEIKADAEVEADMARARLAGRLAQGG